MIRDAKGRKWFMRFKQYRQGWQWEANLGKPHTQAQGCAWNEFFATKALAEEDARRTIQSRDAVAMMREYFRRLQMRGTECRLTAADHKAISRAGRI
jgi:hypothetical protein